MKNAKRNAEEMNCLMHVKIVLNPRKVVDTQFMKKAVFNHGMGFILIEGPLIKRIHLTKYELGKQATISRRG